MIKLKTFIHGGIIFLCVPSCVFALQALPIRPEEGAFTIQYAAQTDDKYPLIKSVSYYGKEIPPIKLKQLMNGKQKEIVKQQEMLLTSWKKTYIAQTSAFIGAGIAYITNYINGDTIAAFKKTNGMRYAIQKMRVIKPWQYKLIIVPLILHAALYPIWRSRKLFSIITFNESLYHKEEIQDAIVVFRKKIFTHKVRIGNTVTYYYNTGDPIGYMTLAARDKEQAIIKKASQRMHLSLLNGTLILLGLFWTLE